MFQEPNTGDQNNELYKPDLVFVKESQASMVDVTMKYKSIGTSLEVAAVEKVEKYKRLQEQIQEVKNATSIVFMGFPLGTCRKQYHGG